MCKCVCVHASAHVSVHMHACMCMCGVLWCDSMHGTLTDADFSISLSMNSQCFFLLLSNDSFAGTCHCVCPHQCGLLNMQPLDLFF